VHKPRPTRKRPVRKTRSKIGLLPNEMRDQVNDKLRDGWQYNTIAEWLFAEHAAVGVPNLGLKAGDSYALAWGGRTHSAAVVKHRCEQSVGRWYKARYPEWLAKQERHDESIRLLEHVEHLSSVASKKTQPDSSIGGNSLIRSLLFETIQSMGKDSKDSAEIARLANAWARLNDSNVRVQDSIDTGLQALRDEIKTNPEALELFRKLRDAVKHTS
jgi:hypothetical protein